MVADAISEKMARNIAQRTRLGGVGNQGHFDISGSDSSCPGGVANIDLEKLIAAHGVTLTITSQDGACPTGPRQFHGTGHSTVTGRKQPVQQTPPARVPTTAPRIQRRHIHHRPDEAARVGARRPSG